MTREKSVRRRGTLRIMRQVYLPEVLRGRREELDISMREAARRAGLSPMALSHLENTPNALPSRETVAAVARAYELDEEIVALAAYGLYFVEDTGPRPNSALDAVAAG